ncbi:MAG: S8 family serine peptidase [Spirochaetia bacterium]|nr:S8 family serine peptidase [Spirochaetia bacterium]
MANLHPSTDEKSLPFVKVLMHDFPLAGEEIKHVWINIKEVQLILENDSKEILFSGSAIYDLLALQFDTSVVIAENNVPVGSYKELRLILSLENYIENEEGEKFLLKAPSGEQTGIKIKIDGPFEAVLGEQLQIVLDFDAKESIHYNKGEGWMLKPVVHVERIDEVDKRYFEMVENEALLKLKPLSEAELAAFMADHNLTQLDVVPSIETRLVRVSSALPYNEILLEIASDERVLFVEPNYISRAFITNVNDSLISSQWGLEKIQMPYAWDVEKGSSGLNIAVLDTGINTSLTEFSGRLLSGYNYIDNSSDVNDDNDHGTMVAGIIGANTNNDTGIAGINWHSKIIPVKILDNDGMGNYHIMAHGIRFAVDNGAKIINISAGGYAYSNTIQEAVKYARDNGVLIVAAAGNDGTNLSVYPAVEYGVLGVGATDENDEIDQNSNFGNYVDVLAPGINIVSLNRDGGAKNASGSSMAAPFVAGLASLLLSEDSSLTHDEIANIIINNTDVTSAQIHDGYGTGRINAARSLNELTPVIVNDLGISYARFENNVALANQNNNFQVSIQNMGTVAASNELIIKEIQTNSTVVIGSATVNLAINENQIYTFNYNPVTASDDKILSFTVELINADDQISNNKIITGAKVHQIAAPDIRIGKPAAVMVKRDHETNEETIKITAPLINDGAINSGSFKIRFESPLGEDMVLLGGSEITMSNIKPGMKDYAYVTINLPVSDSGKKIHLLVTVSDVAGELFTQDNYYITDFNVPEGDELIVRAYYPQEVHPVITKEALKIIDSLSSYLTAEGLSFFMNEEVRTLIIEGSAVPDDIQQYLPSNRYLLGGYTHFWNVDAGDNNPASGYNPKNIGGTVGDIEDKWPKIIKGWGFPDCDYVPNVYQTAIAVLGYNENDPCEKTRNKNLQNIFTADVTNVESRDNVAHKLGIITHYMADSTVPSHIHLDDHGSEVSLASEIAVGDDSYEDWILELPVQLYAVDETSLGIYNYYYWWRVETDTHGSACIGDCPPNLINEPYLNVTDGFLPVLAHQTIAGAVTFKPDDIDEDLFPLYYLMYSSAQRGDWFASDDASGDSSDRRHWLSFGGMPDHPVGKLELDDNDSGDNNDDGDLEKIADFQYTYSIRAIATFFCWFAQERGWLVGYNCPIDNDGITTTADYVEASEQDKYTSSTTFNKNITITTDQTLKAEFKLLDEGESWKKVESNYAFNAKEGDTIRLSIWVEEDYVTDDRLRYSIYKNGTRIYLSSLHEPDDLKKARLYLHFSYHLPGKIVTQNEDGSVTIEEQ